MLTWGYLSRLPHSEPLYNISITSIIPINHFFFFLEKTNIMRDTVDNTPSVFSENTDLIIEKLE